MSAATGKDAFERKLESAIEMLKSMWSRHIRTHEKVKKPAVQKEVAKKRKNLEGVDKEKEKVLKEVKGEDKRNYEQRINAQGDKEDEELDRMFAKIVLRVEGTPILRHGMRALYGDNLD